ncbi:alanine--tRNA ligase [Sphingobacteriales bacterium UPWRP_1]|nr:alanine--tRNA ligase [Sphingobacteriales bacterium TSM_CSM]PSJ72794.1 alanine--tRNA ligase [Sphingobacteriales bacterium UPWRP_1]
MTAKEIRQAFLDFFASKGHQIVPSAPIVLKNDPTLMFTNAGMNQFKDYFLGNRKPDNPRIANSQKCMRVSGKHNDLEDVGVDTYHHTMFEMLGNWSFGNYFKKEAIDWSWELLTKVLNLPADRLYATVFEGDAKENVPKDEESYQLWRTHLPENHILLGNKKDNFWEMGDTGPCGPCTEIHFDMRPDAERALEAGAALVNKDHPQVIEIWNNVFIQFNRLANGTLEPLPDKHVDTGMGFERLVRAIQQKTSNYDTDVFTPFIAEISRITGIEYGQNEKTDIATRVLSDHIRSIVFTIADGQLPSNTGAGYVVRRILRRAVRYAYSYLHYKEPVLCQLVPIMIQQFGEIYPELEAQQDFITKVIWQEETSFLRTLESGLRKFGQIEEQLQASGTSVIGGEAAFELYDTFGFPIDLTRLIATEKGLAIDEKGFAQAMHEQKERARQAAKIDTGDWITVLAGSSGTEFTGYDNLKVVTQVSKYRQITQKGKTQYQMVLEKTPFYAESGGQVGDQGYLQFGDVQIAVLDTKKENDLIVHFTNSLPPDITVPCHAVVNHMLRSNTANNHSATHLLHASLRKILGTHVVQKGSLVHPDYLRFDFSHFAKVTDEELRAIEDMVNEKIRENIRLEELRNVPVKEALGLGAMALFGEKYGDYVRVIVFDPDYSIELCGGTHVQATGQIGLCKITAETSIAAGVRRIEAITGKAAYNMVADEWTELQNLKQMLKNSKNLVQGVQNLLDENDRLKKEIEHLQMEQAGQMKNSLKAEAEAINEIQFIGKTLNGGITAEMVKKIAYDLKREVHNLFLVIGAEIDGKAHLTLMFDEELVKNKNLNAGNLIRTLAQHIQGGGGGQPFYATAGGKNPAGLEKVIADARKIVREL